MAGHMSDFDLPIAVRRARRISVGVKAETESQRNKPASSAAAKTPAKAKKKAVRFSDPGPSPAAAAAAAAAVASSTGLTPRLRRSSIATPKRRRHPFTPAAKAPGHGAARLPPLSSEGPAAFSALHQTADGRVERRIRRNGLRDLIHKMEDDKRRRESTAQAEIASLKAAVKARDREIYQLQNATIVVDTERIWDLEQQVDGLRAELSRRTRRHENKNSQYYSWTVDDDDDHHHHRADPFTDNFMDMMPDHSHFGEATRAQLQASTPSRARSSFPTPPATSPDMPATPFSMHFPQTPLSVSHAGVQAHFPDPAKQQLEEELESLQLEVSKLTATLDSYKDLGTRVNDLLSAAAPSPSGDASSPSPLEAIESQVQGLLQTMSDRTAALTHLTSAIGDLGFPGNDASEMIMALASGFRAARLELEYLTPGEVALPLTSHGAEVLDLLLTRLRELAKRLKQDEESIDEYHEIELSLRKQLDSRVSAMDGLKAEMSKAQSIMDAKNNKIRELQIGNDRLRGAVDGYMRDISELERLVERMEQEGRVSAKTHMVQQKSKDELLATRDASIAELEAKIAEAVDQTAELLKEMDDMEASSTNQIMSMNRQHGAALALRDARVMELRDEMEKVNESLRSAHETIRVLRVENGGLRTRVEEEESKAKAAVDSMKQELQRVLQMSQEFLGSSPNEISQEKKKTKKRDGSPSPVVREGGQAARRRSKRRRYDSGLGFLNEDEVDA